jgi:hypothetical protein
MKRPGVAMWGQCLNRTFQSPAAIGSGSLNLGLDFEQSIRFPHAESSQHWLIAGVNSLLP